MSSNYRMPAEWEPHRATWLSWPHNVQNTWYEGLAGIYKVFAQMVKYLSEGEEVHINVANESMMEEAKLYIMTEEPRVDRVFFHLFPTNDAWVRDHGPIFVKDEQGSNVLLNWEFNSWGGKYPHDLDNQIPLQVADFRQLTPVSPGIILEGGSLDVNGKGTLLTTESCLLNPNRNSQLSKEQIEEYLKQYLGLNQIIWLGEGIAGDDTDGHVDDITRFVNDTTIVTVYEENEQDVNYRALKENYEKLLEAKDANGNKFNVIKLPMPDPVYYDGERLPASYANFYIANSCVLVPVFGCDRDEIALNILRYHFPGRSVIGIDYSECILGLGSIHCLTQQEPD